MRKDKGKALKLREEGKSYKEIRGLLRIPKSTLSEWFKGSEWSQKIRSELQKSSVTESRIRILRLNKTRGLDLAHAYEQAKREAAGEAKILRHHPLFVAGLMLYWGEGDKVTKHHVRLTNTDPKMIRLFVYFLQEICKIPKQDIRLSLLVYPDLDEQECREYWAQESLLEQANFRKSTLIQGRHKTKRLGHGICIVLLSSAYLKTKMLEWIRILSDDLMSDEYYASI